MLKGERNADAARAGILMEQLRFREARLGLRGSGDLARAYSIVRKAAQEVDKIEDPSVRSLLSEALRGLYMAEDALVRAAAETAPRAGRREWAA